MRLHPLGFTGLLSTGLIALIAVAWLISAKSTNRSQVPPPVPGDLPLRSPDPIRLGRLLPGVRVERKISLINRFPLLVRIDRIESTCPCVRVSPVPMEIGGLGRSELAVIFDPSEEPDFRGTLSVDLRGVGKSGEVLFRLTVDVTVADEAGIPSKSTKANP